MSSSSELIVSYTFPPAGLAYDENDAEIVRRLAFLIGHQKGGSTWYWPKESWGYEFFPKWVVTNRQPVLSKITGTHQNNFTFTLGFGGKFSYSVKRSDAKTSDETCDARAVVRNWLHSVSSDVCETTGDVHAKENSVTFEIGIEKLRPVGWVPCGCEFWDVIWTHLGGSFPAGSDFEIRWIMMNGELSVHEIRGATFYISFSWMSTTFMFNDGREYNFGYTRDYDLATRSDGTYGFCASIYCEKGGRGSRQINASDNAVCRAACEQIKKIAMSRDQ